MVKLICDTCKKPTRKFFRMAYEETSLSCKKCILANSRATCNYCGNAGGLYVLYDNDGFATAAYCRSCFLNVTKAVDDDVDMYRDYLEEDMQ